MPRDLSGASQANNSNKALCVGLDASRNRSGGAIAHIKGLISGADPRNHGIAKVHLWAHDDLLHAVNDEIWLVKHIVPATRGSLLRQIAWQRFILPQQLRQLGVGVIFNTDAGSFCPFQPSMTLSQDMLSFEPGEIRRYSWPSRARLRLELLRWIQLHRLKRSSVALFLSEHARKVIGALASLKETHIIPHGIDPRFFLVARERRPFFGNGPIHCLYVSNAAPYKHQWNVVEAVYRTRVKTGLDLRLRLIGGGQGEAMQRLQDSMVKYDPNRLFVEQAPFLPNEKIVEELMLADLFIFASSCENLPITLLEAAASALPIACSNRGPMPEVLGLNAVYFNPEHTESIGAAIEQLVTDEAGRERIASGARERAQVFSWQNCANQTWALLASVARNYPQEACPGSSPPGTECCTARK